MNWMTTTVVAAPAVLLTAFVIDTCIRLLRNYRAALTVGVPIRVVPISPLNPFWVLADRPVLSFLRRLLPAPFFGPRGFAGTSLARHNWRGWEVEDRYHSHHELGDIWILVTPLMNWIYVNEPDALTSVFRRSSDFPRPVFVNEILNVFGPNISTAEGQSWKTMRRIATRCFNEQTNEIVWSETLTLADDLSRYWLSRPHVTSAAEDLRTVSLHVLSRAGFGKSFKFRGHDEEDGGDGAAAASSRTSPSVAADYREALQDILENCVLILALGTKFIANPWLPAKIRHLHASLSSFKAYMTQIYEEEKQALAENRTTQHNLMTALIRASQDDRSESGEGGGGGLTESEIYGNMFTFNFAGHDTTAHTFTFAMYFLAAHPHVQDWLSEEVDAVMGSRPLGEWDYRADSPRLRRCLAVMYESIRLYTPVPVIKWTADSPQPLTVGDRTFVLPPNSMLAPSYGSVQTDPRYWGADSLEWRPSRWIKSSGAPSAAGAEQFDANRRNAFIGWSDGIRDCPGRRFSQVEFVATMAVLFRGRRRVDPVTLPGETIQDARARVLDLIKNDTGSVLLLQMLHPERAPLTWREEKAL